jgi:hypothetical protein
MNLHHSHVSISDTKDFFAVQKLYEGGEGVTRKTLRIRQ